MSDGGIFAAGIAAVAAVIALLIGGILFITSFESADGGHVVVMRNGGPMDNTKVRQVIQPGSGREYAGIFSDAHSYPSGQRFFTFGGGQGEDGPSITVPSGDGIEINLQGTIRFTLNLDDETIRSFDDKFGTRTYTDKNGDQKHAWEGTDGWSAFLTSIFQPIIQNELRNSVGIYKCADIVPSCALVQNNGGIVAVDPSVVGTGNVNLAAIETEVATNIQARVLATMGKNYLDNINFTLSGATLPQNIQDAINVAQASFADVSTRQAELQKAQIEAQTNAERQNGYNLCPACAQIDILKALPPGVTVFAPGGSTGLPLTAPLPATK